MFDAKLIVNGREFPIHYKMLSEIAGSLPDGGITPRLRKACSNWTFPPSPDFS